MCLIYSWKLREIFRNTVMLLLGIYEAHKTVTIIIIVTRIVPITQKTFGQHLLNI